MDDRAAHVLETAEGKHKVGVVHVPGMQRSQSSCSLTLRVNKHELLCASH